MKPATRNHQQATESKLQENLNLLLLGEELGAGRPNRTENLFENTHPTLAVCQWETCLTEAGSAVLPSLYYVIGALHGTGSPLHPALWRPNRAALCMVSWHSFFPNLVVSGTQQEAEIPPLSRIDKAVRGGADIILDGERLNAVSLRLVTNHWCLLSQLSCHLALEGLPSATSHRKEIKPTG